MTEPSQSSEKPFVPSESEPFDRTPKKIPAWLIAALIGATVIFFAMMALLGPTLMGGAG